MNHRVKLGLVVINLLLVVILCFHLAIPSGIIKRFTLTKNDDLPISGVELSREKGRVNSHKLTNQSAVRKDLPQSVIDGVKTFVFFLGHGRSGHSIVGSLMDGHPHMVISYQLGLFELLASGSLAPDKSTIFNRVWENAKQTAKNGTRAESRTEKGYSLFVGGLYQGRYVDHIDVIGDKGGGATTGLLLRSPDKWSYAFDIIKSLAGSLKVIHVIRNPYDNIATSLCYKYVVKKNEFGPVKKSNNTHEVNSKISPLKIKNKIKEYFSLFQSIADAKKRYNLDIIEIHGKDLISDPRGTLLKLCYDLGVICSNNYLEICSNKIFKTESKTRYMIQWTDDQLQKIQQNIEKFSSLRGYSFDSS